MAQNNSYLNTKYIDPLCDFGFKKLFGNDKVKDNLISFITAIYPHLDIVDLQYINTEVKGIIKSQRSAVYDIACTLKSGQFVIVEMQYAYQTYYVERTLFYTAAKIYEQAPQGEWDFDIKAVYTISILNFSIPKLTKQNLDKYIWKYSFREESYNTPLTTKVNIAFIELPKFNKSIEDISNSADIWLYLLRNLSNLTDKPKALQDKLFVRFFELAEILKLSPDEQRQYQQDMFTRNDYQNCINTAKRQGLEEGKEAGLKEGIRQTVINALKESIDINVIAKISGLPLEEVQSIQATLQ